ncbi:MAG TPA: xanthine dehydrogenase family protein subunit M [Anaerolineae bacterium]|jgi:carbon-monoxide dehydrogenase medium subunit|nr:xanthine dehydrogenase family protein subunit M [Anaerolineae bacterium]
MKPAPFEYVAHDSLPAVLRDLSEHGDDAKLLAGGQSLVPAMNFRLVQPSLLVDINLLNELAYVQPSGDGSLRIGALTRHRALENSAVVAERAPLMQEAMPHIAHLQIRTRGTIGGSLAHADPAAELPVILVALNGRLVIQNESGRREVDASDFFQGLFTTALQPEDMLVEVIIPPLPKRSGWAFVEFARRRGDYALLGVAAGIEIDEGGRCRKAKLVYLNAGDVPIVASGAAATLEGQKLGPEAYEAAAVQAAEHELTPVGNIHASAPYLRRLAHVLTLRALKRASNRALSSNDES